MAVDFDSLLQQAREGAPRSIFTPYMESIADPSGFNDPTHLRLLGNAIANSLENAALLAQRENAIAELLKIDPLGLQVLYNGTVGNDEFAKQVVNALQASKQSINPSPAMKNLLGSVWEQCGSSIPEDFMVQLAIDGFVELILQNQSFETNPRILANFKKIYENCQKLSIEAEEADEISSLGFQVVGNITSHREFTLKQAEDIKPEPFTWETVILLSNLSASKSEVEKVLAKWPNLVDSTIRLIEAEDPEEDDEDEDSNMGDEGDEGEEPPFDLELWGTLFRNVARDVNAAKQIAKHHPAKLFTRLLISPSTQTIAGDFATAFASNVYDHDLTETVTSEPHNGGSALIASAIVAGLESSQSTQTEIDWALPRLVKTISNGLLADSNEGAWIKGTRALAILRAKFGVSPSEEDMKRIQEHNMTAQSESVRKNLEALRY